MLLKERFRCANGFAFIFFLVIAFITGTMINLLSVAWLPVGSMLSEISPFISALSYSLDLKLKKKITIRVTLCILCLYFYIYICIYITL